MEERFAFILRLWVSDTSAPHGTRPNNVRGTLQAVNSTEFVTFQSLRQLNALLEEILQSQGSSTHSPPSPRVSDSTSSNPTTD
jgi:hypothetical protein